MLLIHTVFRYVPEELPEVKMPVLASKKWPTRKRANTFPEDGRLLINYFKVVIIADIVIN